MRCHGEQKSKVQIKNMKWLRHNNRIYFVEWLCAQLHEWRGTLFVVPQCLRCEKRVKLFVISKLIAELFIELSCSIYLTVDAILCVHIMYIHTWSWIHIYIHIVIVNMFERKLHYKFTIGIWSHKFMLRILW